MSMRSICTALAMLIPSLSVAAPMIVSGSAEVFNNDIANARQRAIDNALSQAVMAHGGTISINQHSANGVLLDEQVNWNSSNQVRSMELLSEQRQQQQLTVEMRVDLEESKLQRCRHDGKVKVIIPRAKVRYRQQLIAGGIYQLDSAIARVVGNTINGESSAAYAQSLDQLNVDFGQQDKSWITELARQQQGQYVLTIDIDDVAVERPEKMFGYIERDGERTIAMTANLYDGFNGQHVWQQRYRGSGNWPYERQESADTATERFWNTEFGEQIQLQVQQMSEQINTTLTCAPIRARIINIQQQSVQLDIGEQSGLKVGDTMVLTPQQQQWGFASGVSLKLTQVRANQALAQIVDYNDSMGVQIGDWAERKPL
ncbi:flagellar assembly protein T N-terminal domain-containing protein [Ferrimonas lipolytica]|uniref:Flagellar assembly protein T, C-terminal domain n=1 Tax=Ferrimonas lipolytica TaxID=2724191 RepID=A0A6H1UF85_9GAMM|nr:flagellar assembly protein T N-terminal domain-containing protein [Ferrimonas lipolytica]QIZ77260.1 hypothetical protein HER31_10440 [Ferrimonas lipolytica]